MTARLLFVGVSQRTAPIELRDRLASVGQDAGELRAELVGDGELVVLATCNRFELYAAVDSVEATRRRIVLQLAARAGVAPSVLSETMTSLIDDDAVLHLCRVAVGLDSPILGEAEILGQVRAATAAATRSGAAGPLLGRVFACAVRAGRRARSETALGERPGSLASVAADLAAERLGDLAGRRVLVVGAGAMGALAAERFRAHGCELVVASRTRTCADALAARVGGRATSLDALDAELAHAAVIVSCTRSPGNVVDAAQLAVARAGSDRPLVVLDLALPRDVDPAVATIAGCRLYDLDAVHERAGAPGARAREAQAEAEAIARAEAARFGAWRRSRAAVATIASLREHAEAIRTAELARRQRMLTGLNAEQRRAVEQVTTQIVSKLLHEPTVRVKQGTLVPALRELFALEETG